MKFVLVIIKGYFRTISVLSPRLAGTQAFKLFQKTASKKFKSKEEKFYKSSNTFIAESSRGDILCYENGDPNGDLILLVHGWNSNAGSMAGIGERLVKEGKHVISFDLPAHGKASGKHTNLIYCKDAMLSVLHRVRTDKPITIVSHSFGSLVTAFSLSTIELKVDQLIFLTCPGKTSWIFQEFKGMIGLGDKAYDLMISRSERILKESVNDVSVLNKLGLANFSSLDLIHDVHDKILPYSNSVEIVDNMTNAELHTFEKIGHYRMLWNPDVIQAIVGSLKVHEKEFELLRELS